MHAPPAHDADGASGGEQVQGHTALMGLMAQAFEMLNSEVEAGRGMHATLAARAAHGRRTIPPPSSQALMPPHAGGGCLHVYRQVQ